MNRYCWILIAALTGVLASACKSPQEQPDPRDVGLNDPMNYNPVGEWRSVSGRGGITDYDRKEMQKDLNDVLNPYYTVVLYPGAAAGGLHRRD